jgi:phospholipid N-methyltransferase
MAPADPPAARRDEMIAALVSLVPFESDAALRAVELGSADGRLTEAFLDRFSQATLLALEPSDLLRQQTAARTVRFGNRLRVRAFDIATLDWWDLMHGADVIISCLALHVLNEAKTQYLYKAAVERMSEPGALLVADTVAPAPPVASQTAGLFHHLVWLKHAGLGAVDCFWRQGDCAVYGGFKAPPRGAVS